MQRATSRVPLLVVVGAEDPLLSYATQAYDRFEAAGHETIIDIVPQQEHKYMIAKEPTILDFFFSRHRQKTDLQ